MGTNFFTMSGKHIGKRSAAGKYCWDCRKTLCKGGEEKIHYDYEWYNDCPVCGKPYVKKENTAGMVELGFSKEIENKGVGTCCSFNWAVAPERVVGNKRLKKVKNEYGEVFTREEFEKMLENLCPIWYRHSIGEWFRFKRCWPRST